MNISTSVPSGFPKSLIFGILALLSSTLIAILIHTGIAEPHPDFRFAYFICVGFGVAGLIQLIIGITELK